jgi:hypothetical protein
MGAHITLYEREAYFLSYRAKTMMDQRKEPDHSHVTCLILKFTLAQIPNFPAGLV